MWKGSHVQTTEDKRDLPRHIQRVGKLQEVTCQMYMPSTNTTQVNKLRYQLFCGVETLTPVSFHLVKSFHCMPYEQTPRLLSGGGVWSAIPVYHSRWFMDGRFMMGIWPISGCEVCLLCWTQRLCWTCYPAHVYNHVNDRPSMRTSSNVTMVIKGELWCQLVLGCLV